MRGMHPITFLLHPLVTAAVAALGAGLCAALSVRVYPAEVLTAALVTLAAAELAVVPLWFVRGKSQLEVSQAALVGTVVQMLASAAAATAVMQWAHPHGSFIYWLFAFYWSSLAGLILVLRRAILSAPMPPAHPVAVQPPTHPSQGSEA